MIIKRVDPMSVAKIAGVLYGGMGLLFGAFVAAMSLLSSGTAAAAGRPGPPVVNAMFGLGAVVAMPLLYGGMGAVMSFLGALFYNWVAGMIGGIQIETE